MPHLYWSKFCLQFLIVIQWRSSTEIWNLKTFYLIQKKTTQWLKLLILEPLNRLTLILKCTKLTVLHIILLQKSWLVNIQKSVMYGRAGSSSIFFLVESHLSMAIQMKKFSAMFKKECTKWVDRFGLECHQKAMIWWKECSVSILSAVSRLNKLFTMIGLFKTLKLSS